MNQTYISMGRHDIHCAFHKHDLEILIDMHEYNIRVLVAFTYLHTLVLSSIINHCLDSDSERVHSTRGHVTYFYKPTFYKRVIRKQAFIAWASLQKKAFDMLVRAFIKLVVCVTSQTTDNRFCNIHTNKEGASPLCFCILCISIHNPLHRRY